MTNLLYYTSKEDFKMNIFNKKNYGITLNQLAENWLLYKKYSVKDSTYFRYQYIIKRYIIPNFQDEKLYILEDCDFNRFIDNLMQRLSKKTIKDVIIVLKSMLRYAESKYHFDFKLNLITIPKNEPSKINILTKVERKKLENFCKESASFRDIGIVICLNTGIRIGEICALTWNNIDLENDLLRISQSMQRIYKNKKNTTVTIDTPKTKTSIREIPISTKLHKILTQVRKENMITGNEFFLTGSTTKYIEPRNYQYMYKNCLKKCNIPYHKFHVLRHTFATECVQIGMDVKSLSEILGHASVDITLNKYVHSSFENKKKYLEKL